MTTVDSNGREVAGYLSIEELMQRYKIGSKATMYERLNAIRDRIPFEFVKQGRKSVASPDQVEFLDRLDEFVRSPMGWDYENWLDRELGVQSEPEPESALVPIETRLSEADVQPGGLVQELITVLSAIRQIPPEPTVDPLDRLRKLEEIASHPHWRLPSNELAALLGLRSLPPADEFTRYGFYFERAATKQGNQKLWAVRRDSDP